MQVHYKKTLYSIGISIKMKPSEIREMKQEDLQVKLQETQRKLFELRCQNVTEKNENSHAIKNCRKDIARMKTILNEKRSGN
jgi:large subunit ribosomal protein L29